MKHIQLQLDDMVHMRLKREALDKGMTLKAYISSILNDMKDIKVSTKKEDIKDIKDMKPKGKVKKCAHANAFVDVCNSCLNLSEFKS